MRIIRFLLSSLFIMAVFAGLSFLVVREGLLFWGSLKVEQSLGDLKYIAKNQTEYIRKCKFKGNTNQTNVINRLQLRFTSPADFQTEVICDQFPNDPIVVKKDTLPLFVTKLPEYSGVIWGDNPSGVLLELWGRQKSIGVFRQMVQSGQFQPGQLQPITSCAGYSQVCCQAETQQGVGTVNDQVTDCPRSCYTTCQARPVILSFTSDPFYDQTTRTVSIQSGDSLSFAFVVSSTQKLPPKITVRYGDGQEETLTTFSGQAEHVYLCATHSCTYRATIAAEDQVGITSAVTPLSTITILIQ